MNVIKGLHIEDADKIIIEKIEHLIEKYNMKGCSLFKYIHKHISINECFQDSDDSFDEFLYDDKVIAIIYKRRNDANTIDLYFMEFKENTPKLKCTNTSCPNNTYDPQPDEDGNIQDISTAECCNNFCEYPHALKQDLLENTKSLNDFDMDVNKMVDDNFWELIDKK